LPEEALRHRFFHGVTHFASVAKSELDVLLKRHFAPQLAAAVPPHAAAAAATHVSPSLAAEVMMELERLRSENEALRKENAELRSRLHLPLAPAPH
jgi:hypothetical protein